MSHFAQSFWSQDYAGGLGVLFGKIQQGVKENEQVLTIARMRADAEDLYGQHISDIAPAVDSVKDGFQKDDGASLRKAYDGMRTEMIEAAAKHRKVAQNIRELVVYPFGKWCDKYAMVIQGHQDELQARVKNHDRQAEVTKKLRSQYFNKCRLVEDLEEEDKLAFKDPSSEPSSSPKQATPTVKIQEPEDDDEPEPVEIGDQMYQPEQVKAMLSNALNTIKKSEVKVPILGTYQNVSTGADITEYIQKHLGGTNVGYAERIGQDLISLGYLRLIGSVGNTFANSSRMNYQWRPKAFQIAGLPDVKKPLARSGTVLSTDSFDSPLYESAREYISGWNPLNNPYPNETPSQKLRREAKQSDEKYRSAVRKQDLLRCQLEEAMFERLAMLERHELDRLKAVKAVILDFSGALSNVIPSLQSTVDKMMLFQETIQPLNDLRYLLENYRTGAFTPKVQIYENYYNSIDDQTFGVDIEARARADKKRVPTIITSILTFLDNKYPLMEGDEARRQIWVIDVPLAATHRLRAEVNNGQLITPDVLERYEVPIVASLLKVYLLELPDSLVSSSLYDVIKALYSTSDSTSPETRISILQNTLGQLRLTNIATLDAITTHFARLVDLTSAPEEYVQTLTRTLAPCILRTRNDSGLSFEDKYHLRFLRDLLDYKEPIFSELKRTIASGKHHQSSLAHSASVHRANSTIAPLKSQKQITDPLSPDAPPVEPVALTPRQRTSSNTDESNRRMHMEERNRMIAQNNRSRTSSPNPQRDSGEKHTLLERPRGRSGSEQRGPETRFPVHVSHVPSGSVSSPRLRTLEVPSTPPPASLNASSSTTGNGTGSTSTTSSVVKNATEKLESGISGFSSSLGYTSAAGAASSGAQENGVSATLFGSNNGLTGSGSGTGPSSSTKNTNSVGMNGSSAVQEERNSEDAGVNKSDSLQRRTGLRKTARPLSEIKRSSSGSLMSAGDRMSAASLEGHSASARGVELVDRPVDLD